MTKKAAPTPIAFAIAPGSYETGKWVPSPTVSKEVAKFSAESEFFNTKNKAEGPRRYGYTVTVEVYINPDDSKGYRPIFQTTLNGSRYQSSKYGAFYASAADAIAAAYITADAAMKRYAKLADKPGSGVTRAA